MQLLIYLLAAALGFFGLVFVVGSQGEVLRLVVGVLLFAGAAVLVYLTRARPQIVQTTVQQKIDLSGDVKLENLTCKNCGGRLTEKSINIKAGAVFIHCEFCGTAYQLEEAPKW
ncbi:MAG: hypothetical protein RMK99_06645 [Anaerolineales bacterium]|nr:hypothetical protein [Anaerolineales bacterium]